MRLGALGRLAPDLGLQAGDDVLVIGLDAPGGLPEELEHIVYERRSTLMTSGEDGATIFDVRDAEGNQTLIRLESSA